MIGKTPTRPNFLMIVTSATIAACGADGTRGPGSAGAGGVAGSDRAGSAGSLAISGEGGAAGQTSVAGSAGSGGAALAGASAGGGSAGASAGGAGGASGDPTAGTAGTAGQSGAGGRSIAFGTLLDAAAVMSSARDLAQSQALSGGPQWRAKGDQHRTYRFPATNADEPYRLYVPSDWDGSSNLPLAMFLHGSGNDESSYIDQNGQQLIQLAQHHGYVLVSPRGVSGAYGNFLRLSAPFGDEVGAAELMAAVTPATERANQLSEQDVINVLELVLHEYPIDPEALFLFGHSMGSGGAWYIGAKYATYWRGLAPMSGPFVQERGYPWEGVRPLSLFVSEGTQAPSLDASRLLAEWLMMQGFTSEYREVSADHGGMVPLVLPEVFEFFDAARGK